MTHPRLADLLRLHPTPGAYRVALRAGLSVAAPLLLCLAVGHEEWTLYAVFGAFTSLYGRNHVHLSRAVMQVSAGAALTATVVLGAAVAAAGGPGWLVVFGAVGIAVVGELLSSVQDWHPPGPLFLVFGFGAVATAPGSAADLGTAALVAGASAGFAVAVGNIGWVVRRQRSRPARLAPAWSWRPVRHGVAVLVAGSLAVALGIGHPYWAMVAAVAPLTARGVPSQLVRAWHRVIGTLLGLLTALALLVLDLAPVPLVLVVVVLQVATELVVGRNYGLAMLFITPMALLMGQLAAPRPIPELLFDRGVETVVGAAVAMALVGLEQGVRLRRSARSG